MIRELFYILTPEQRKRFYVLQFLVILMALMELFGIASIGPFMALVADPSLIQSNQVLEKIYKLSELKNSYHFIFFIGICVLLSLALASFISIITTWRLSLFAMEVGAEIGGRLYKYYLNQDWLFHASGSSAQLTKQIATETLRVTFGIINPIMQLNARAVLAVVIIVAIIMYNPFVAFGGVAIFLAGYLIIYKILRNRIVNYGRQISEINTERFRLMNEGFGGIKDVLLLNCQDNYVEQFNKAGDSLAKAQGVNQALSQMPRYFMELIAFGAMIGLVLTLVILHDGVLDKAIPVLAVYALAGFKLLPALQLIYASITTIKGNYAAFEAIKPDLVASRESKVFGKQSTANQLRECSAINTKNHQVISLENITFTYPNAKKPALNNISLTIPLGSTVGFVGESGSGKSTIIDLILGLIDPERGQLKLDDTPIKSDRKKAWQKNIGFVPQNIFLSEGTIAENIAFGVKKEEIDIEKVKIAIKLAHLEELVDGLPEELDTKVGERGVKLSGGQRQRIGIARALYNEASVLVLDEATSALDGITEKIIMDAINELSAQRTIIIIAHRLKTVRQCDAIYLMEKGRLVDQGSYADLIKRNKRFGEMARLASE